MRVLALNSLFILLLCSCTPTPKNQNPSSTTRQKAAIKEATVDDETACEEDTDCTLINNNCCNCNHGGSRRAVNIEAATKINLDRKAKCMGTMCPAMISQDPSCAKSAVAKCENQECVVE